MNFTPLGARSKQSYVHIQNHFLILRCYTNFILLKLWGVDSHRTRALIMGKQYPVLAGVGLRIIQKTTDN